MTEEEKRSRTARHMLLEHSLILFLIGAILTSCSPEKPKATEKEVVGASNTGGPQPLASRFEIADGSKLLSKDGQSFDTGLHRLEFIGELTSGSGKVYFLFSGVNCDSCDANSSIYIHAPTDGKLIDDKYYSIPGKMTDFMSDSVVYESRAFYGQVLDGKIGAIWYQKTLQDDGNWKSSIYFYDLSNDEKQGSFLVEADQLKQTLALLEKGLCKEIPGYEYSSAP